MGFDLKMREKKSIQPMESQLKSNEKTSFVHSKSGSSSDEAGLL